MTLIARYLTLGLFLGISWVSAPSLHGQQTAAPTVPAGASSDPSQQPTATDPAKPVPTDPKTGLPLTPAELREREIDKLDPMKRDVDPTVKEDPNRLTDRDLPAAVANPATAANPNGAAQPLPGSIAASNGGGLTGDDSTSGPEYSGPAVLSRSYTLARPMGSDSLKWKVSLGFNWSWDIGQVPGVVTTTVGYPSVTVESYSPNWSLSGRHRWKFDQFGLALRGNYSTYTSGTSLSGLNNSVNLDFTHVVSRRLSFHVVQSLQDLSQNYSLENPTLEPGSSVANINVGTSPNLQILDNTVRQSNSNVSVTYHQTSRISYDFSGTYFLIGQTQPGFIGTEGRQATADINYRWTHKATVGAYYNYTNYHYSHNVANADTNGVGLIYSYALTRRMQLRTRGGAARVENLGYESVALPPELAAILGQGSSIINAYTLHWISDVSAELVRDFGRSRTASLQFVRGVSPGNGVQLTSTQETINGGFATRLFRDTTMNLGGGYSSLESILQGTLGYYNSENASFAVTRRIRPGVDAAIRVDYRHYDISGSPLLQHDLRISIGMSWSPAEDTLRF